MALELIADVLPDLARRIAAVEARVGDLAAAAPPDAEARIALQDLDLIGQTVADLARLASAALAGGDDRPDVLSRVLHLSALRARVDGGGDTPRPTRTAVAESGTIDFFPSRDPVGGG